MAEQETPKILALLELAITKDMISKLIENKIVGFS
jgi:hypothetical protein